MKGNPRAVCKGKENDLRIQKYVRRVAEVKRDYLLHRRMSKTGQQRSLEQYQSYVPVSAKSLRCKSTK